MKLGDLVRSKNYNIEGTVQDIGPCDHIIYTGVKCEEIKLTLDPPGEGAVRFYHHASSFEIVNPK